MRIGIKIKKVRKEKGITQEALAEKLGTKGAAIRRLENNPEARPKISTLKRIADALDVPLSELMKETNWTDDTPIQSFNSGAEFAEEWKKRTSQGGEQIAITRGPGGIIYDFVIMPEQKEESERCRTAMNEAFDNLNLDGQKAAVVQVALLAEIPKYQKGSDSECPASQNAETPTGSESATDATPPENK